MSKLKEFERGVVPLVDQLEYDIQTLIDTAQNLERRLKQTPGGHLAAERLRGYFINQIDNYLNDVNVTFGIGDLKDDVNEILEELEADED